MDLQIEDIRVRTSLLTRRKVESSSETGNKKSFCDTSLPLLVQNSMQACLPMDPPTSMIRNHRPEKADKTVLQKPGNFPVPPPDALM